MDGYGWKLHPCSGQGKFRSTPSQENDKGFRKKVKNIVNKSNYGAKIKAEKLAPILIGALLLGEFNSPRVAPEDGKLITAPAKSTLQYTPSGSLETVPSTS
ncbi:MULTISPECIES: hypothetical protein [unclassified Moorena]|uniref:hypothetical protein n=1 Tax=unclassified Moorena TaxID=2683338 RepID=UPI0013F6EE63|nr:MULTISPECIES: hypothetical protein [unclassified Moorena]NEO14282.1 hypothetical protein [Moorena sp. SIO3E8]NEP29166.1 hypothetical protein [Moorena sp. SIO3I6]NEQ00779.1 hypothetical protein [Moorena sp. SIO3F7]